MKHFFVFLIEFYQVFFSPLLRLLLATSFICRYSVSCSEYGKKAILNYGVFRGTALLAKRILLCNPFVNQTRIMDSMGRAQTTN